MTTPMSILARYKSAVKARFTAFCGGNADVSIPPQTRVPANPQDAILLGILIGRQQGFSSGLLEGVQLGLKVSSESQQPPLCPPFTQTPYGEA